jgi:hypothetical protein
MDPDVATVSGVRQGIPLRDSIDTTRRAGAAIQD